MLTKKYGSPTSGWRSYLDPDAHGKLSFLEFCTAVRAIGYTGSLKKLWAEFELGPGSFITLAHLDPDADRLLESFFDHLEKKHGIFDIVVRFPLSLASTAVFCEEAFFHNREVNRSPYIHELFLQLNN